MAEPTRRPQFGSTALLASLALVVCLGVVCYGLQSRQGLGVTGLSRDIPWGLYIAQFTFLVGIGASAVTVLLPYYVHRQKSFANALVLGEIVAVLALVQALTCILVDLGQPARLLNIFLYPSPTSLMFWDCLTLTGYLAFSIAGLAGLLFARAGKPGRWVRPLALATIPWAIGIHVVTALLYAGLSARPAWMSAVLAPRFLATAFASGPALLILLGAWLRRAGAFDIGDEATGKLTTLMTYAALTSLLLAALEAFTALYSGIPAAGEHLAYLFVGLEGHTGLVAFSYGSVVLLVAGLVVLLVPALRRRRGLLLAATASVLLSVLVDKGLCLVTSGFVPSPLGYVHDYAPTWVELGIVGGIYAGGALGFLAACRLLLPWAPSTSVPHDELVRSPSQSAVHALNPPSTAREPAMAKVAQMEN